MTRPKELHGVGASPGAAIGKAYLVDRRKVQEPRRHVADFEVQAEASRLTEAIRRSDRQLEEIRHKLHGQPQEHGLILEAHMLMLADPAFAGAAEKLIHDEQVNAEWAVRRVVKGLKAQFEAIDDAYFRERQSDLEFVGDRVVQNLLGEATDVPLNAPENAIIVAQDLSPADAMLLLGGARIAGIVCEEGGRTSHTAIVARALEVPAVLGVAGATELIGSGDVLGVDGVHGVVVLQPEEADVARFSELARVHEAHEAAALATRELSASTQDGHVVVLRANIEFVEEVAGVVAHGAEGVGLYRTEFLFLNRKDAPSEEEHYENYRRLLLAIGDREVTVRTFDLGGDKTMHGRVRHETNPALGLRAVRYCLAHPDMFEPQLRALWRAGAHGKLRVMLPMITGVGEVRQVRVLFEKARRDVIAAGHKAAEKLPLGIMVETPAAAMCADRLAKEVAFFSVGTNDLVQYALALDRANADVAALFNPLHPAVLAMLQHIVDAGHAAGIPVSVCGEMAGDPLYTLVLLAIGVDELSMTGTSLADVKRLIRSTTKADAETLLAEALAAETPEAAEAVVRAGMTKRFPALMAGA